MGRVSIPPNFALYEYPRICYQSHFVVCFTLEWQRCEELCHSGILKVNYFQDGTIQSDTIAAKEKLSEAWVAGLFADSCGCPDECANLNTMRNLISSCVVGNEEMEDLAAWDRRNEVSFVPTCQSLSLIEPSSPTCYFLLSGTPSQLSDHFWSDGSSSRWIDWRRWFCTYISINFTDI